MKYKSVILKAAVLLAAAGVTTGCATIKDNPQIAAKVKNKDEIVIGITLRKIAVADICEAYASSGDERCKHPNDYDGYWFGIANPLLAPVPPLNVSALVPKTEGYLPFMSVAKLRMDGNRPAHFELLVSRTYDGDRECYWGNHGLWAAAICPKYGWDYRKDLDL